MALLILLRYAACKVAEAIEIINERTILVFILFFYRQKEKDASLYQKLPKYYKIEGSGKLLIALKGHQAQCFLFPNPMTTKKQNMFNPRKW